MIAELLKGVMLKLNYMKLMREKKVAEFFGKAFWKRKCQSSKLQFLSSGVREEENNGVIEDVKKIEETAAKTKEKPPEKRSDIFKILKIDKNDDKSGVFEIATDYKAHKLDDYPKKEIKLTRYEAVKMLREMQIIRAMERAAGNLYREKIIRGFLHLYIGQEAIAVGMHSVLRPQDNVITAYRCHGWCYVTGTPPSAILAELAGKSTGVQRGKGGSMHMYNSAFYGGNGIVGGQIPLGVGIALASDYRCDNCVCVMAYGDGAANQGQIFEAYNMAALWELPCIFVCENNQYGMGTSAERSASCCDYYTRGDYIPGLWVNGMDIVAVRSATEYAIEYALETGPIVLEMHTYRYQGHSMSDPGTSYRPREEIEEVRKKADPIDNFQQKILNQNLLNEEELKLISDDVKKEIAEAVDFARSSTEVDLSELCADVYSNNLEPKIRGTYDWNLMHKQLSKGKNAS